MTLSLRRLVARTAMAGLLAWAAYGCAVEVYRCGWILWNDPYEEPSRWRFRSMHVQELREFADAARARLPVAVTVAVSSNLEPAPDAFIRYLWLAYFLPEYDLIFVNPEDRPPPVDYRMVFGSSLPDPPVEILLESGEGVLYRAPEDGK